jgi:hypothetical protein
MIHEDHNKEDREIKTVDRNNNKEDHNNKIVVHNKVREIKTVDHNSSKEVRSNKIADHSKGDKEIKIVDLSKTVDHNNKEVSNNKDPKAHHVRHKEIKILRHHKIRHHQNQKTNSINKEAAEISAAFYLVVFTHPCTHSVRRPSQEGIHKKSPPGRGNDFALAESWGG